MSVSGIVIDGLRERFRLVALSSVVALAACGADAVEPRALMRALRDAALETPNVQYDFRFTASGDQANGASSIEGTAYVERMDESGLSFLARVEGRALGTADSEPFLTVRQLDQVLALDVPEETVWRQSLYAGGAALFENEALMYPFFDPMALEGDIEADTAVWEGRASVAGDRCDVVRLTYLDDEEDSRWCIDQNRLPRRMEWLTDTGSRTLEIWNVDRAPELDGGTFDIEPPPGFTLRARWFGPSRGSSVPAWALHTADGGTVSLSDLAGRVVVLDFWATWCPPCISSLRGLEELAADYAGEPVSVFAVNTMESGEPIAFLERLAIDVPVLLDGDEVHGFFAPGSLPAVAVVDPSGRVFGVGSGYFGDGSDRYLRALISGALEQVP